MKDKPLPTYTLTPFALWIAALYYSASGIYRIHSGDQTPFTFAEGITLLGSLFLWLALSLRKVDREDAP